LKYNCNATIGVDLEKLIATQVIKKFRSYRENGRLVILFPTATTVLYPEPDEFLSVPLMTVKSLWWCSVK
jgi:hypothetical protein